VPAREELTQVERDKLEIDPNIDFRAVAARSFSELTPNELGMFKWSGVYHQLQRGYFMIRVSVPGGTMTAAQLRRIGRLATTYAQDQLCITTRQTLQFHWVRQQDIYRIIEGVADVGLTTRNACGDVCRNVVSCSLQGVCPHEVGDTRPVLDRIAQDPVIQEQKRNLPRKHKISVSGCASGCGHGIMNCQGFYPVTRETADGDAERGWAFTAGGGLGSLPHMAKAVFDRVPEDLVLHVSRAVVEIHNRRGNRRKRRFARTKIIVDEMGGRAFGEHVLHVMSEAGVEGLERITLSESDTPSLRPFPYEGEGVIPQKQAGLNTVRVMIPRSEFSGAEALRFAQWAETCGGSRIAFTPRQNLELRDVPDARLAELSEAIRGAGYRTNGFEHLPDVVACVGTTMCNLAVSDTPRAYRLLTEAFANDETLWRKVGPLRINMNGCPNSCGQHWIADIGLRGKRQRRERGSEEGFSVYVGGRLDAAGHIAEHVRDVSTSDLVRFVRAMLDTYVDGREQGERFGAFARRVGGQALDKLTREKFVGEGTWHAATLPGTGGLADTRPETPSPYPFSALSRLAGRGNEPRDVHWLAENIPCQAACPAHTDIPAYLTEIHDGNHDAAYRINLRDNVFPAVLGRVCARPCEAECRHGCEGLGESVSICFSKRAAADWKPDGDPVRLPSVFPESGRRVAVVGGGVAGLAAARQLALFGHGVTLYEKHRVPGGMLNQGIPVFRLPRDVIDREVEQVRLQGVNIVCGTAIGKDLALESLVDENDAVVLAAGTLRPNLLDLRGKDLAGIRHGLDFLREVNETGTAAIGNGVIVIGGGFTAMDCARTAARLKTEDGQRPGVRVLYRRSVGEMLVTPGELEELGHEGIGIEFLVSPAAYLGDGERLTAIRFVRNELGAPDSSGRRRPVPVEGSEFEVAADTCLLATGQFPETSWIMGDLRGTLVGADGWPAGVEGNRTPHERVFVAGDFATGPRSLIDAIGHAKTCARSVDAFLMGGDRLADVVHIEDARATGRIREMDAAPLQPMPTLRREERTLEAEVERGYDRDAAVDEAQRCYRCHFKYEIDSDKCIYCDWCIRAKPRPDCIVKVRELQYGQRGEITGFIRSEGSEDTRLIYINQEDCIRCGACVDACPADCISIQKVTRRTVTCGGGTVAGQRVEP